MDGGRRRTHCHWFEERTRVGTAALLTTVQGNAEGGTLQHQGDGDGRRRKAHELFPDYERDARLVPTHKSAGLGGCYSEGGAEEE